ncbi:MAG: hypothetical protein QM639_00905 [Rhodocyclaceae bacterium]
MQRCFKRHMLAGAATALCGLYLAWADLGELLLNLPHLPSNGVWMAWLPVVLVLLGSGWFVWAVFGFDHLKRDHH